MVGGGNDPPKPLLTCRLVPPNRVTMKQLISARTLVLAAILSLVVTAAARSQTVLVLPYVQPGDGRTLTGTDVKVIHWLTDQTPGDFRVDFYLPGDAVRAVRPERVALDFPAAKPQPKKSAKPRRTASTGLDQTTNPAAQEEDDPSKTAKTNEPKAKKTKIALPPERDQHYFKYSARIDNLPFNAEICYSVRLGGRTIRESSFRTRATPDRWARCVLVGDMAQNSKAQDAVAYHISRCCPEFLVALGDIVYPTGRVSQYMHHFWDTYNNVAEPSPRRGAPLMASVTFYPVLGNHDIGAGLAYAPDALAAYHFFSPPEGGPGEGPWTTPLGKDQSAAAKFRALTQHSYPNLDAYSFDYGPAHFVVLNDNRGLKITAQKFLDWLRSDLKAATGQWKFVCYHVPGFHSSWTHYPEQQARLLQPVFEECGVTMTFAGHVHNYQRTVPLKFVPVSKQPLKTVMVNGEFTLDTEFDGVHKTRPSGVIHIVAGGGGAGLYGPGLEKTSEYLREWYQSNYADFTARMVADKHSFVVLDLSPERLELQAIGANGALLDHIAVTRSDGIRQRDRAP
jgi:hypothetical protein